MTTKDDGDALNGEASATGSAVLADSNDSTYPMTLDDIAGGAAYRVPDTM